MSLRLGNCLKVAPLQVKVERLLRTISASSHLLIWSSGFSGIVEYSVTSPYCFNRSICLLLPICIGKSPGMTILVFVGVRVLWLSSISFISKNEFAPAQKLLRFQFFQLHHTKQYLRERCHHLHHGKKFRYQSSHQ